MFGPAKSPAGGLEMMLKSFGLGEVMDAAKTLASSGSIEKILAFADEVGTLNERLERIERLLTELAGSDREPGDIEAGSGEPVRLALPGPGGDNGRPGEHAGPVAEPMPAKRRTNRQPRTSGAACGDVDAGGSGSTSAA